MAVPKHDRHDGVPTTYNEASLRLAYAPVFIKTQRK